MTKVIVSLQPAATPFWVERQLRLCRDLGVRIHFHGNPRIMWVWADQDGQRAMMLHAEVDDFTVSPDQCKGNEDEGDMRQVIAQL
jgi:hypothetical protein